MRPARQGVCKCVNVCVPNSRCDERKAARAVYVLHWLDVRCAPCVHDVRDPALQELADMDELLRCPICREHFTSAMMLPCSHNCE